MFVSKYNMIQIALFGLVGVAGVTVASAEMSDSRYFSMDFIPRNKVVSILSCHSKTPLDVANSPCRPLEDFTNPSLTLYSQDTQQMLRTIRAGGTGKNNKKKELTAEEEKAQKIKRAVLIIGSTAALYGLFHTRSTWIGLFDKEKLQAKVVDSLEKLNSFPYLYSRSVYTLFMAIWECLGMSTIPVETAAGMVFGWSAIYWSGIGKFLGAALAFGLGRGALSSFVEEKLSSNEFLNLVKSSTADNPLLVVTLIKLSCFPETVKNFGSAILRPIQWWMFLLGTVVHGLIFTSLWTYFGVDTAARLKDVEGLLPPDRRLKVLLTLALINGAVVSPLSMYYWMRTLKQKRRFLVKK